ncbi:ATP-binding protein [Ancylobacter radicis]|uniref:histidine kinase n=1 Tax=Ancylobacter radicis TaxID=2836179 RepID=A0ABS5R6A2_9HYPH|nr:ATP-binding protein [Ancylobacter radicis]MBS9477037.1 HAMP domain-containing protein [Ancylobacter radicis]
MNTIRTRLIALLVGAVLTVVALATALSLALLPPPPIREFDDAVAGQIALMIDLAMRSPAAMPDLGNARIALAPVEGEPIPGPTEGIGGALARRGVVTSLRVANVHGEPWPVVSAKLADGRWLVMSMPMPPIQGNEWVFVGWILIITLGTTLVIVAAVRRLTQPLALLESAAAAIGPDGELAPLEEKGPTEVRAAAQAINRLSARLKEAMESRMRLVAAAGHDLRTPMTRMRLRAEFLADEERAAWVADLDELDRIADSAIRLVREEVAGGGGEPVRLDALVAEVATELGVLGVQVQCGVLAPATIMGRPLALRRALRNLIINAATHGRGATLRLHADQTRAIIEIEDRGPGIPEALLPRVFEPFFRIDPARTAPTPGAGLGLAIAHEIIMRHGGTLTLRNIRPGLLQTAVFPLSVES